MTKTRVLWMLMGCLAALSFMAGCGLDAKDEASTGKTEQALTACPDPLPDPGPILDPMSVVPGGPRESSIGRVCLVTCVTDSMGLCSAATGGQACAKAGGGQGTCTSTVSGCTCQ